ncbi:MAG: cell division protein ZapA [Clostridia bacterium]|nr:cell division protein ZapA [Clostridia bacterium]
MQKIRTTVRIAGKEYTIASTDSEAYVNRVASWVDRRMSELAAATRLPATQLAVLTAVNAADDMMKSRDEIRRLEAELEDLRAKMAARPEEAAEPAPETEA